MTIAVSVKVNDGLVFASDSATTMMTEGADGRPTVQNVYNHANKIFNLHKALPIAGMTFGAGSIGHASISTLAKDLRRRFMTTTDVSSEWYLDTLGYTIESVARQTRRFLCDEKYDEIREAGVTISSFGFWIGGYGADSLHSELWKIEILDGECLGPTLLRPPGVGGIDWSGEPEAISRLVLGCGSGLPAVLKDMGVPDDQLEAAVATIQARLQVPLATDPMPIQDAIDLAEFLVDATAKFSRFKMGAPTVGGPIEISAITKHEGFKWVKRKHYFRPELNPEVHHGRHQD